MKNKTRRKLKAERRKRIKDASKDLLKGKVKDAREKLDWIEATNKLINSSIGYPKNVFWPVIIGIVSMILIGLLLTIRIPTTILHFDIYANDVAITLENDWELETGFNTEIFYINNLSHIHAGGLEINSENIEKPFELSLTGNIQFSELKLNGNTNLKFEYRDKITSIYIKNDSLVSTVYADTAEMIVLSEESEFTESINKEAPEYIEIFTTPSIGEPVNIQFRDTTNWLIRDMTVTKVEFLEEEYLGSRIYESSIISGALKLIETNKTLNMEQGDFLNIKISDNSRFYIKHENDKLKIHFEGNVKKILFGPKDAVRNIKPNIIEYLYNQELWAFIWSAILVLSGLLWSTKKTIFE